MRQHKLRLQAEVGLIQQRQKRLPQRLLQSPLRDVISDVITARSARRQDLAAPDDLELSCRVADRWQPRLRLGHVTLVAARAGRLKQPRRQCRIRCCRIWKHRGKMLEERGYFVNCDRAYDDI